MRDLPHFALSAILMVPVMMLTQFSGLKRTSATHAALIIGMIPVLMAVASVVFDRERVGKSIWVAAVLSTLGVGGMVIGSNGPADASSVTGDLLVLASAVGVTAACVLLGTLAQAPITLAMDGLPSLDIPTKPLLAILGLGVGCTAITYGLWNWGLNHVSTARAGVLVNLEPLVGAAGGIFILNESAGPAVWFGGALILGAAVVAAIASPEAAEQSGADAGALPPEGHLYSSAASKAAP
jgi:drug/metabolite transporter (DMT)-like permease